MNSYDHDKVLGHWQKEQVESMYDKYLLQAEINLIRRQIANNSKILDVGCGEGEGTLAYAGIEGVTVHGADFSETRLSKARSRLSKHSNVSLMRVDFTAPYHLDSDYDYVISQRFLINITDWEIQKKILINIMGLLKPQGRLVLLEGYQQGVDELNIFRNQWLLPPIPVQWHNLFLDQERLLTFMHSQGYKLIDEDGLGAYFLLTRGVRPALQTDLNWDCEFNRVAGLNSMSEMLPLRDKYSRLKLWCFEK